MSDGESEHPLKNLSVQKEGQNSFSRGERGRRSREGTLRERLGRTKLGSSLWGWGAFENENPNWEGGRIQAT